MPLEADTPILTLSEAAKALGLSIESVRKYVQKDRIKPKATIGRAYLFTQEEVERFKPTIRPVGNPNFRRRKVRASNGRK